MTRQHGVQCKECGQSISIGIADPGLPIIPLGPVHCPYCRQEWVYLEQDRIEFDTDNGLPLVGPA
jgi:DNA-directed RNA polymerase subunit RPC12/RpoP